MTVLAASVSLFLLAGVAGVQPSAGAEYLAEVVRIALLGASVTFVGLMFLPGGVRLDRRALPVLVFAAVACLSVIASPAFHASLARLELYYAVALAGMAIGLALPNCRPGVGTAILLAISVVHAGFLLIAVQFAVAAVGEPDPVEALPYFANIRHFGYQGFFGASAAIAVAVADRRMRASGVVLAAAALFGIIVFGSRGAFLAWCVFVLAAAVFMPARRALLTVSGLALVVAVLGAFATDRHDWLNTMSLLERARTLTGALYVVDRLDIWRESLGAIAHRPLLGFGPEAYQISGCCNPSVVQPHNSILQILLEFGVAGMATLVWSVVKVFGARVREATSGATRLDRDPVRTAALAMATGFLAFSLIDGLVYYPVPLVNFALVCAVLLAAPRAGSTDLDRRVTGRATRSPASSPGT